MYCRPAGVCERQWEVIYSHDETGNRTFGDKKLLRELAMTGSHVKAQLYMPDHILQLSAVNMNKRGDEVRRQLTQEMGPLWEISGHLGK